MKGLTNFKKSIKKFKNLKISEEDFSKQPPLKSPKRLSLDDHPYTKTTKRNADVEDKGS